MKETDLNRFLFEIDRVLGRVDEEVNCGVAFLSTEAEGQLECFRLSVCLVGRTVVYRMRLVGVGSSADASVGTMLNLS